MLNQKAPNYQKKKPKGSKKHTHTHSWRLFPHTPHSRILRPLWLYPSLNFLFLSLIDSFIPLPSPSNLYLSKLSRHWFYPHWALLYCSLLSSFWGEMACSATAKIILNPLLSSSPRSAEKSDSCCKILRPSSFLGSASLTNKLISVNKAISPPGRRSAAVVAVSSDVVKEKKLKSNSSVSNLVYFLFPNFISLCTLLRVCALYLVWVVVVFFFSFSNWVSLYYFRCMCLWSAS